MSSSAPGSSISPVEVVSINAHGISLLWQHETLFLPYTEFPWFQDQPESKVRRVTEVYPTHLYWPDMDIDLSVESIRNPERFPLKSRA